MGMSASQARLLSITARLNDVEFKSQEIANIKIRLADESEQLAMNYTKALNRQKYTYTTYRDKAHGGEAYKVDLTPKNLNDYGFKLVDRNGNPYSGSTQITSMQMYDMIESGEFMLQQFVKTDEIPEGFTKTTWKDPSDNTPYSGYYKNITASENYNLNPETDSTEFAKAEAEYNAANMKINNKEKLLDNEMKKLDTEHNALSTEMDSLKNLIGKNIEKSFNLFS